MASYPTTVKSFTAKNTDDTIQAAHINDLQDEVNAIEGGLLNSLAHHLLFTDATYDIGASGATRPRDLFLSRNATIGGALNVKGGTTLGLDASGQTVLTVANNATGTLAATTFNGLILIRASGANGGQGTFAAAQSNTSLINTVTVSGIPFTGTADTASSFNVYVTGGNYVIQNKSGVSEDFKFILIKTS